MINDTIKIIDSTIISTPNSNDNDRWAKFKNDFIDDKNITNIIIRNWSINHYDPSAESYKVSYRLWYISIDIDSKFAGGTSFLSSYTKEVSIDYTPA